MAATKPSAVERGRTLFELSAWRACVEAFAAVDEQMTLDDIDRYATAAHLAGDEERCLEELGRGYKQALKAGDRRRAAMFAFWRGHQLMFEGHATESSGWFMRARQLATAQADECPEQGYAAIPEALEQMQAGELVRAEAVLREGRGVASRCGDASLFAILGHILGRVLIQQERVGEAMEVLDEVMVALTAGEVWPLAAGNMYCGVLEACHEVLDLKRAREWTAALGRWCEGQPELVPHRGPCLVYRAEVMQLHGEWADALQEAQRACDWLSSPASPEGPAEAFYRLAELQRLRGEYDAAEASYRQASRAGRQPEPGLPLLWLARGQGDAAQTAIQRALLEEHDLARRAALLDAAVQVGVERGDVEAAHKAVGELQALSARFRAPALEAMAATAEGAVLVGNGRAVEALPALRRGWAAWQRLGAPYEAARVRRLIAQAYRAIGDEQSAAMELDAARWVFEQLGAAPDLAEIGRLGRAGPGSGVGDLTDREVEVLRLLAAGLTNRQLGAALVISEHTVARHVQNLLGKLELSSRAALAAFAVEHGLRPPRAGQN